MIRALLIDDEEPARLRLRSMLEDSSIVEVVGEADDGETALQMIEQTRPDLIFLDIEMPGRNGLQVASMLRPPRPQIIFCTAYDQYAIEAFEHHAADYLLKPLSRKRLQRALDRLRGRRELSEARETQQGFLPRRLPESRRLDFDGVCRPAREIGGDYYDFLELCDGRLAIVLADVAGKGLPAALLAAGVQARIQTLLAADPEGLGRVATELNRSMCSVTTANRYVTAFVGIFDDATGALRYVNAGHEPPLWIRSKGNVERLPSNGMAIGLFDGAVYEATTIQLEPGETLIAFSDGVTETVDADGNELGCEPLAGWVGRPDVSAAQGRDQILRQVDDYRGDGPQIDDVTLIVAKVRS